MPMGSSPIDKVRDCYLGTLNDLNTSSQIVREILVNYLVDLLQIGVKGFRVDAAKHMWPEDLKYILVRNIQNH